jgi:serralysin
MRITPRAFRRIPIAAVRLAAVAAAVAIGVAVAGGPARAQTADLPAVRLVPLSQAEGNAGFKTFYFEARLNRAHTQPVSLVVHTVDGSAKGSEGGGNDYHSTAKGATIPAGELSAKIGVAVAGDTQLEADEWFNMVIDSATNATIAAPAASITIFNDDFPRLSINNASVSEGDAGEKTVQFTVSLTAVPQEKVTVQYATASGSATKDSDYLHRTGEMTFYAGMLPTSKTISITVLGDTRVEGNETFFVNLFNAQNATVTDGQGVGTIFNDDIATPPPCPPTLPNCQPQ